MIQHVVEIGDLPLFISDDGKFEIGARDLVDVLDPAPMAVDRVGREADQFYSTLGELWFELCKRAEFGGAHGSIIFGMREENNPLITNEIMEINGSVGGIGFKVRGLATET